MGIHRHSVLLAAAVVSLSLMVACDNKQPSADITKEGSQPATVVAPVPPASSAPTTLPGSVPLEHARAAKAMAIAPNSVRMPRSSYVAGFASLPSSITLGPMVALSAGTERFPDAPPNGWQAVLDQPVSTLSADVDTASYAYVRRAIREGHRPPAEAVRIEQMINYFPYAYPRPEDRATPFRPTVTVLPSPWTKGARLVHIGLKGWDIQRSERPRANVTLLLDVSGSMEPVDRLPLIRQAARQLAEGLRPEDRLSIVTYASGVKVVLEPTSGQDKASIIAAIDSLYADGGTNGGAGLQTAYAQAEKHFDPNAVNRIVLATDGDFNLGETSIRKLEEMVAAKRWTGIYLTVLGVGTDNLNDALMQRLAHTGNGQAFYLDSLLEARKVWVDQLSSTMTPIADDVKIQIEFNPSKVAEYRLIGYETRMLKRSDFSDDKVDAGEVGAGHSVTAIYEILPVGASGQHVDPLRYQAVPATSRQADSDEIAFLRLRYKEPSGETSRLMELAVDENRAVSDMASAPADVRFAVAVAGFGQLLRGEKEVADWSYGQAAALAEGAGAPDPNGWRSELVQLIRAAGSLQ